MLVDNNEDEITPDGVKKIKVRENEDYYLTLLTDNEITEIEQFVNKPASPVSEGKPAAEGKTRSKRTGNRTISRNSSKSTNRKTSSSKRTGNRTISSSRR